MPVNLDIDTTDLMRVERPPVTVSLPAADQPIKSPFYVGQVPSTATVNPDAVRNFHTPGIPFNRVVPPEPLALSGSSSNTVATPTVSTFQIIRPPAPTIAQALSSTPTGYTFSFYEVRLPLDSRMAISAYKVYRNSTSDISGAQAVQTYPHNPNALSTPVVVQDAQPNAVTQFYWVSAINTSGLESALTPAQSAAVTNKAGLNSNSQLASSFNNNPINTTWSPIAPTVLSNNGTTVVVAVAANTNQFAPGQVSYNSGTVNLGVFGGQVIFVDDPTFQGGAVPYSGSASMFSQAASEGRLILGKIITNNTSATTGGGTSGGTTGIAGAGGRGVIQI